MFFFLVKQDGTATNQTIYNSYFRLKYLSLTVHQTTSKILKFISIIADFAIKKIP